MPLNWKSLKALIPHWSVVLVFFLIAALGFLYYATVQRSTSHYIARNFVHLNEVSEVLSETVEVMKNLTRFADYYCTKNGNGSGENSDCKSSSAEAVKPSADEEAMARLTARLAARLVANSPYVTRATQISLNKAAEKCQPCKESSGTDCAAECIGPASEVNVVVGRTGMSISWKPEVTEKLTTLTVPFEDIEGLVKSVQYYDTLMIAGDSGREVFFDSANLKLRAQSGKPDSYFYDGGSYERFNTIDTLVAQRQLLEAVSSSTKNSSDSGKTARHFDTAFPQSTIVPVVVGGVEYLAFVQPLSSPGLENQKLYVIGMVRESRFDAERYAVPLSTSAFSFLFVIVLVFSLSLIRVVLIEENGVVGRWDLYVLIGSALGLISLLTLAITSGSTWYSLGQWQDGDLALVADRMEANFQQEIHDTVAVMQSTEKLFNKEVYDNNGNAWPAESGKAASCQEMIKNCSKDYTLDCGADDKHCSESNRTLLCKTGKLPAIASLFTLDTTGRQRGVYATFRKNPITSPFNLASREYFQRVQSNDLWSLYPPEQVADDSEKGESDPEPSPPGPCNGSLWADASRTQVASSKGPKRLFLDRIKSRSTGQLETVIAVPADEDVSWWQRQKQSGIKMSQNRPQALVAITSMTSLEEAVLPVGFGFVVIESTSGKVLYHRDQDRSLLENFYDAIGHELTFKTHVATGLPGVMNLTYKGDHIRANVRSLDSLPLSVISYYKFQPIRTLIFQFSISAFILALMFLVYQFIWLILLEKVFRYLFESPPVSRESPVKPMWKLNVALLVLALLYSVAIYLLSDWWRLSIVLGGPVIIYIVARSFGGRFFVWVMSGPSRDVLEWHQSPVFAAQWTTFFFSILLATLPTIAIFLESMELHERSWRQLNNWSLGHAISRRADFFHDNLMQLNSNKKASFDSSVRLSLRDSDGVYLPHTQLLVQSSDDQASDCSGDIGLTKISGKLGGKSVAKSRQSTVAVSCLTLPVPDEKAAGDRYAIRSVLTWVPDLTIMSSILERFTATYGSSTTVVSCGDGEQAKSKSCSVITDPQHSLMYRIEEFFPHAKFASADHFFRVLLCFLIFLTLLWFAARRFLNMIAPIRLLREIRRQARNKFRGSPLIGGTFYSVIPAQVGETEKIKVVTEIAEKYRLNPLEEDAIGRFLAVREDKHSCVVLLRNLEMLFADPEMEPRVRAWLIEKDGEGKLCLLVVSRLDLSYLKTRRRRGEKLFNEGAGDWELLMTRSLYVPFYRLTPRIEELDRYRIPVEDTHRADTHFLSAIGQGMEPRDHYRQWQLCSVDEKMALASLAHNGVTNVADVPSLHSLYNRGLITVAPLGISIRNPEFKDYVASIFPRQEYRVAAAGYHDDKWRIFRAPIYILLGAVVLFVAYAAQDELANVLKIVGGFGTTLALLNSVSERFGSAGGE